MARPSNTDQRRAQIADALLKVMVSKGYEHATIEDVAKAAKLTKGLLHYHFANKDEILVAAIERLTAGLEARYQRRLEQDGEKLGEDPRAELEAWLDAHLALGDDADPKAVALWVVIGAEAVRSRAVRNAYSKALARDFARIETLIARILRKNRRSTRGAKAHAAIALAAIEGSYHVATAAPGLLPAGFAARSLKQSVFAMLDAKE